LVPATTNPCAAPTSQPAKLVLRQRGASGAVLPNKQRVNIFLDGAVIEHFKAKAGDSATKRRSTRR
jgi:uncharacterized protein (DUF4415 family)